MVSPYLLREIRTLLEASLDVFGTNRQYHEIILDYFDALRLPVLITDTRRADLGPNIMFANEAFAAMCAYPRDELVGGPVKRLQGPDTDLTESGTFRRRLEDRGSAEMSIINYRKTGEPYRVRVLGSKLSSRVPQARSFRIAFALEEHL
ncbi:MAG: PAS domain-containing protein [Alphaproteobacteria bacterium]|jgi:PAS domain-containing protein|nr:PAS domain-containing protein [Alphaproteobacteria bacterium]